MLFFSLSQGKLPGYILVALPPLAIWIGEEWTRASLTRLRTIGILQALMLLAIVPLLPSLPAALARGISYVDLHWCVASGKMIVWTMAVLLLACMAWRVLRFGALVLAVFFLTVAATALLSPLPPQIALPA